MPWHVVFIDKTQRPLMLCFSSPIESIVTCDQEKAKEIEARFAATKAAGEALKRRELQEHNTKRVQKREAERLRRELELQAEAQAREVRGWSLGFS